jgi:hypothetical protein
MGAMLPLVVPGGSADIAADIAALTTIAELAPHWKALAAAAATDVALDTAPKFLAWLLTVLAAPETAALFATQGLAPLLARLQGVQARLADLPGDAERLLLPLGAFAETATASPGLAQGWIDGNNPGLIAWSPAVGGGAEAGRFQLRFGLEGALEFEAGALWPFRGDAVPPSLLRISLQGKLAAEAGAALPFRRGTLGASAGGEVACGIHFFFRETDTAQVYAAALASALARLPDPFDAQAVWKAFSLEGLDGLILTFEGEAHVAIDLAVGRDVEVPALVTGKIGASIEAALSREASYQLSLRGTGDATQNNREIVATLSRDNQAADRWAAGLGVELDLASLATRVHGMLSAELTKWDAALDRIKPLLLPGDWLGGQGRTMLDGAIRALLDDPALGAALPSDLALLGKSVDGTALEDALRQLVGDAVDSVTGAATGAATNVAGQTAAALVQRIPTLAPFGALLTGTLTEMLSGYAGAVRQAVDGMVADVGTHKIECALDDIGVKIGGGIDDAQSSLVGIRALLSHYDGLLRQIVAATAETARAKVVAHLAYEETRLAGGEFEVCGTFSALAGEAGDLYRSLLFGRLAPLEHVFENPVAGFELVRERSSIRRFCEGTRKLGYSLLLLGFDIEGGRELTGKAEIWRLGNGDMRVASEGGFKRWRKGGGEERSLAFVSAHALLVARAEADRPFATLSLAAVHTDADLRRSEVTGFLTRLVDCGLLAPARLNAAERTFDGWGATRGGGEKIAGSVRLTLALDPSGIVALADSGRAALARPRGAGERRLFSLALDAMRRAGDWNERDFGNDLELCRRDLRQDAARFPDPVDFFFNVRGRMPADIPGPIGKGGRMRPEFNRPRERVAAASALITLAAKAATIFDSTPAPPGEWTAERYEKEEMALAKASAQWLRLNKVILSGFREEMHRRTAGFYLALACLARNADPGDHQPTFDDMVALTMQRSGDTRIQML